VRILTGWPAQMEKPIALLPLYKSYPRYRIQARSGMAMPLTPAHAPARFNCEMIRASKNCVRKRSTEYLPFS